MLYKKHRWLPFLMSFVLAIAPFSTSADTSSGVEYAEPVLEDNNEEYYNEPVQNENGNENNVSGGGATENTTENTVESNTGNNNTENNDTETVTNVEGGSTESNTETGTESTGGESNVTESTTDSTPESSSESSTESTSSTSESTSETESTSESTESTPGTIDLTDSTAESIPSDIDLDPTDSTVTDSTSSDVESIGELVESEPSSSVESVTESTTESEIAESEPVDGGETVIVLDDEPHDEDSEETKKAEEEAREKAEEARLKEEEEKRKAEEERKRKEEERLKQEEAAKKEAQQEIALSTSITESSGSYTGTGGGTYYSSGYSYTAPSQVMTREAWLATLSPYERLIANMRSATKNPAVVRGGGNIYEGKGEEFRIVGTIPNGGLVYILEDGEWAYVESGQVRGFIQSKYLEPTTESGLQMATVVVDPAQNAAFTYLNVTVADIPQMPTYSGFGLLNTTQTSIKRNEVVAYAMQFVGRPYVWGGEDLWNGTDCSGFVKGVYAHFGITLPRTSYEQCYAGEQINAADAKPGDLLFYARDGVVYHVIMYIGGGKAVQAQSSATGIVVADVNYDKVCWGIRLIQDGNLTSTQAIQFAETGKKAAEGDEEARDIIIDALATASENEWNTYSYPRSVLIAQTIMESDWLSFSDSGIGGISAEDNNVLGMNQELNNEEWDSPWTGEAEERLVAEIESGEVVYGNEMMRTYTDIESCMDDYAAFKVGLHPDLKGETNIDLIIEESLQGYATDPDYQAAIKKLINDYDLTQYDSSISVTPVAITDGTNYSQEQMELIWAIVAQEDDTSYEGALAVISTAMNRADQNYGGHGQDAYSQLTAEGQFCYSASVSDPIYYQRRLGGNVPEYVKQAVEDCLTKGTRNHSYTNFRSSNRTGNYVQIGGNWYF